MTRRSAAYVTAGTIVLAGVGLGWWVAPGWYLLPMLMGANLLQAGLTGFCPAEMIFGRLGLPDRPCPPPASDLPGR